MILTPTQNQLYTATSVSSIAQCHISFRCLSLSIATFIYLKFSADNHLNARNELMHMVLTTDRLSEVAIESWPQCFEPITTVSHSGALTD